MTCYLDTIFVIVLSSNNSKVFPHSNVLNLYYYSPINMTDFLLTTHVRSFSSSMESAITVTPNGVLKHYYGQP